MVISAPFYHCHHLRSDKAPAEPGGWGVGGSAAANVKEMGER